MESFVLNEVWGFDIAVEMTLLGIGAFSAILAVIYYRYGERGLSKVLSVLAVVLPLVSLGILFSHLLKQEAAIFMLLTPRTSSYMPFGAAGITGLVLLSAIFLAPMLLRREEFWSAHRVAFGVLAVLMIAVGVFTAAYTGLVIAAERGIPFWHSAAVPVIALLMGAVGGLSVLLVLKWDGYSVGLIGGLAGLSLLGTYLVHVQLSLTGPEVTKFSASVALGSPLFSSGIVAVLIFSLIGLLNARFRQRFLSPLAGVLGLLGIFLLRVVLLTSGAWALPAL